MKKKASDFRYNTGETRVPWAAVGENYNAEDLMAIVKFMMKGQGKDYSEVLGRVEKEIYALDKISTPPAKLSLDVEVQKAEEMCDEFLNTEGCVFLTNCTAGFEIACKYTGLRPGDEVIVPAITFAATMAYPLSIGCKMVFADVDPVTLNMDPRDVERKITDKTKMIIPVHIGGYPVDMDPIMALAEKHGIIVLEDAAHGFGGEYKGKKLGTIGHFGAYSFHEVKNMTSFGEGGILTTNIKEFRAEMKRARFLGTDFSKHIKNWLYDVTPIQGKDGTSFVATNFSTTEIQALGLQLQLSRYDEILKARREVATYLTNRLSVCDAIIPQDLGNDDIKPTFHLYSVILDPERAGGDVQLFKKKLDEKGVTQIAHFGPLYRFEVLRTLGYNEAEIAATCPVTEEVFDRRFTHFPIYNLTKEQLDYMADAILESIDEMQKGI